MRDRNSTVALIRCDDYDPGRVRAAIRKAISLLPRAGELLKPGQRVLLKPNLLSSNDPIETAINTHPEFVRAVAELFTERGCKVFIGDSCGNLARGSTEKAIAETKLDRVAEEVGAEIVNFDKAACVEVEVPNHRILARVRIPRLVQEVDLFVTLPKLKTHELTLLTGAVKNQYGLIPGKGKKEIHMRAPKPALLADAVLDVYSAARPHLAVMDAITGMEGKGPAAGDPRHMRLVLAGEDCLAVDAVAAKIMGFGRDAVDTIRLGRERGIGIGRLAEIKLLGLPLAEAIVPGFKKPAGPAVSILLRLAPTPLLRWGFHISGSAHAAVIHRQCVLCGDCVANCPVGALVEKNGRIETIAEKCIACYCCSEVCKERAIVMRRPFAGRILQRIRRLIR